MHTTLRLFVCFALLLVSTGCRPQLCTPGKTETCACPGGNTGAQRCTDDGAGFDACECTAAASCSGEGAPSCGAHGLCTVREATASCGCFPGYSGANCAACATGYQDRDGDGTCTPSCASLTCGAGTCDDTDGSAACTCPQGRAGETCSACASGFQDHDDDGACEASCATSNLDCGAAGTCVDVSGAPSCTCATGHTGATCNACASGFQDADGNGVCTATCATALRDCGAGGTCSDSSGTATCSCAAGYVGASCAQCAAGFQDNDHDNSCVAACSAAACGSGTCDDSSGRIACTCPANATGPSCAQCAVGFQDHDGDGTCTAACSDTTCGLRETCVDTSGAATCVCLDGFSPGDAGTDLDCQYTGGPRDPEFSGTPAGAWNLDGGWVLDPTATGLSDAGVARLLASSRGDVNGSLSQPFTLDSRVREGMALSYLARVTCQGRCERGSVSPLLRVDGTYRTLNLRSELTSFCVGAPASGSQATFIVTDSPYARPSDGQNIELDALSLVPSAQCPAPGELRNGDFEGTQQWAVVAPASSTVTFINGAVTPTRGARLEATQNCETPSISTPWAVDHSTPNLALRFTASSALNSDVNVHLDAHLIGQAQLGAAAAQYVMCVPNSLRGAAGNLTFSMLKTDCNTFSRPLVVNVDDVEVVSDARCAPTSLYGGTLESLPHEGWSFRNECANHICAPGVNVTRHVLAAGQAHSGSGFLQLVVGENCATNDVTVGFTIPASSPVGGPALRFFYKLPTPSAETNVTVDVDGRASQPLSATSSWAPHIRCLEPTHAGRYVSATFRFGVYGGCFAPPLPTPSTFSLDDVDVYLDPTCPR